MERWSNFCVTRLKGRANTWCGPGLNYYTIRVEKKWSETVTLTTANLLHSQHIKWQRIKATSHK
jgi:hypothetical protein